MERASFSLRDKSPKAVPRKGDQLVVDEDTGRDSSEAVEHTKVEIKTIG